MSDQPLEQIEMFKLPNPCIGVCESGPKGYCKGCLRSREERFDWHNKPEAERSEILRKLSLRQKRKAAFLAQLQAQEDQQAGDDQEQLVLPW
ncbi:MULTISPECIES: DUF1289 domain-containing protein [Gammaproteobacteria]|uniref:DUF1289 domain-containing protein n=1 Tax=Gammaproteobacteria TaxID=1236 RepID=UPI000DD0C98D|nr:MULTISPECIES: DUF1289 domain-containing protein [Gammaproteobacteria]RTE86950.1 DUF1289 domain-containing protein [Aliidiomarina sp. B3213]TCZ93260.1 DUF1289 domain-containing protein [Lysobacter sp. N42]